MLVPSQNFNKKFKQDKVEHKATHCHHEIAHQLNSAAQIRTVKDDVHAQVKTDGKRNEKSHDEGSHVRRKGNEPEMQHLLVQNVVKENVVKKNIEQRVAAATSRVMVGLQRHEPAEQRIKNVQHGIDCLSYVVVNLTHEDTNLPRTLPTKAFHFVKRG